MPTDEVMLQEAIKAAREGDKTRARDLLTRLLRIDKDNPEHWLWMSAVVETRQEQIFCLKNLLRLDPDNRIARRGLIMMGELKPKPGEVKPVAAQRRQAWQANQLEIDRPTGLRAVMENPTLRRLVYLFAGIFVIGAILLGFYGARRLVPPPPTPDFVSTARAIGDVITLTPTLTPTPTETPIFRTPTPTPANPTPLAFLLDATYTPTPLYVNTEHPSTEAFRLGMRAMGREDWTAVAEFMSQTIQAEPDAVDAYYYQGYAYLKLEDNEKAQQAFDRALALDMTFGPAHLGRALARLGQDPEVDVGPDFRNAVTYASDYGLVYIERAAYAYATQDFTGAQADLNTAQGILPESPLIPYHRARIALAQNLLSDALGFARSAHDGDFTHLPTYLLLGQIHYLQGNFNEAVEWLDVYTRYHPDDFEAQFQKGQALTMAGNSERALQIYESLQAQGFEDPLFHLGLGMVYLEMGDPELALDEFNKANRLKRNDFDIMLALGVALLNTNQPGDAYVQLSDTLPLAQIDPQTAHVLYYRGLALKIIVENGDESSRQAAIRDLNGAIDLADFLRPDLVENARAMLDELQGSGGG